MLNRLKICRCGIVQQNLSHRSSGGKIVPECQGEQQNRAAGNGASEAGELVHVLCASLFVPAFCALLLTLLNF